MKKVFSLLVGLLLCANAFSQEVCWVFFTDKANTTFDPYSYFDSKAIERYRLNHADLYDSTNFPLNAQYCGSVANLSDEVVGESRWLNAMAVVADENAIAKIQRLPFVKKLVIIQSDMSLCSREEAETMESGMAEAESFLTKDKIDPNVLHAQLKRMGGEEFVKAGTRGKGIRIAVLDGGFPMVDKHEAFQHLRDNHQILNTYNFPKKCENVYGWNSHGTMTLSCICGLDMQSGCAIGLATEAEFLLARTEVGPEPKKEEVWWVMGVEWADKNGAQLISSSLGYGNINHWPSETDGTSTISKAANMAVEKGILICNSAGNEGTEKSWPGIILPADAENVLTVGGINPTNENHQDFASYGPTADGRLKPNVSAYAFECRVAAPNSDHTYKWVAGTSFSCPLVAGFAACAWQNHPEYTALQLKREIEKCAELYPYYDYAVGYGVPQAGRFLNPSLPQPEKTFDITQDGKTVYITPHNYTMGDALHYHIRRADGRLYTYRHVRFDFAFPGKVEIELTSFGPTDTLCVWYNGYCEDIA
nr:S8 family serine peptidase [Bacteroidales bacterium]